MNWLICRFRINSMAKSVRCLSYFKRRIILTRKRLLSIIMVLLFVFAAFYNGLIVKRYPISTDKLGIGESVRIVLIADLHNHIYGENQSRII